MHKNTGRCLPERSVAPLLFSDESAFPVSAQHLRRHTVRVMQPRTSPPADHAAGDDHGTTLAPVVSLARERQRRARTHWRDRVGVSSLHPDPFGAWLGQFLDATRQHGCVVRTIMTSVAVWRDLIGMTCSHPEVFDDTDTRRPVIITPASSAQYAAIENVCTLLTNLGAEPRLDVELSFAPDYLHLAVRGLVAEPVMAPDIADDLTAALQATTTEHWTLDVTDTGALHWHSSAPYRAVTP